jgi:hypothetical protein
LNQTSPKIHFLASIGFAILAAVSAWVVRGSADQTWRILSVLSFCAAVLAWLLYLRARYHEAVRRRDEYCAYPEGQARLIDSGRLPNRYNPRISLKDFEVCHFFVNAHRILFRPLPDTMKIEPDRLLVRFSGGLFYFIVRPQEILLPAEPDDQIEGELIITNQRVIFSAPQDGFEVQLQSLKLLDCSAHLVDFQVRGRRYTIKTEAACYAEKVLGMLMQKQANPDWG